MDISDKRVVHRVLEHRLGDTDFLLAQCRWTFTLSSPLSGRRKTSLALRPSHNQRACPFVKASWTIISEHRFPDTVKEHFLRGFPLLAPPLSCRSAFHRFSAGDKEEQAIAETGNRLIKNAIVWWHYLLLEHRLSQAATDKLRAASRAAVANYSVIS